MSLARDEQHFSLSVIHALAMTFRVAFCDERYTRTDAMLRKRGSRPAEKIREQGHAPPKISIAGRILRALVSPTMYL